MDIRTLMDLLENIEKKDSEVEQDIDKDSEDIDDIGLSDEEYERLYGDGDDEGDGVAVEDVGVIGR